jgi:LemA protein
MQPIFIVLIVVAALLLLYIVGVYNRFVNLRNGIESNLKQITVAMKKRLDLIGQVVDSVKGQMKFEKGTLAEITKLRSEKGAFNAEKAKKADKALSQFVSGLNVQVEAYPALRSNENVTQLIASINGLEDEISRLRYVYNNTVQEFNTKRELFPSSIVAGMFGFSKNSYLEFDEPEADLKKAPKVALDV